MSRAALESEDLSAVSTPTPWKGKGGALKKEIMAALSGLTDLPPDVQGLIRAIGPIIDAVVPDKASALEKAAATLKLPVEGTPVQRLLDGLTFSELAGLAARQGVVPKEVNSALTIVNARRNEVAHFRLGTYDEQHELEAHVREILAALARPHET